MKLLTMRTAVLFAWLAWLPASAGAAQQTPGRGGSAPSAPMN